MNESGRREVVIAEMVADLLKAEKLERMLVLIPNQVFVFILYSVGEVDPTFKRFDQQIHNALLSVIAVVCYELRGS